MDKSARFTISFLGAAETVTSHVHPRRVFVTHGEPAAADALRLRLRERLGWDAVVPDHAACFPLPSR